MVLLIGDLWGLKNYYAMPTVPLDQVAAAIGGNLHPGDGLLLSRDQATRWGLAYYLGPPYKERLVGLDVTDAKRDDWSISDREQALRQARLWVVVPDGETPTVDPATLIPTMTRNLRSRFGPVLLERYDRAAP